ncbi:leucine-rich repeat and transmembrane domain-containing protein 2-like [Octopus sinensis]|uniref:Leucine-rich repeat and transmembrane domain-containing protein 2-like n=1 Tax=Octopus sinensis TaxID=2607531 RepID=A0A6P7TQ02_9MOLL|nr:leucine-rich repeat and transmembrane domain-containing protein 2-like [Octopus sinensis]
MFRRTMKLMLAFMLTLYLRLFSEGHAVPDFCTKCRCNEFQTQISCASLRLITVPPAIPVNVEYLNLKNNKITNIGEQVFQNLTNLKKLELRNNEIQEIDEQAFHDLTNLKEL